jgi:hypothetical protein
MTYPYNNLMIFLELLMKKEKIKEVLEEILRRHSQRTADKKEALEFATTNGVRFPTVIQSINKSLSTNVGQTGSAVK